jgi:hypothetical protein
VVGVSADSMDIARGIGERDGEAFSDRPNPASVTIQASICSSLYLILQGVPLLEVASLLLTVVRQRSFFPSQWGWRQGMFRRSTIPFVCGLFVSVLE